MKELVSCVCCRLMSNITNLSFLRSTLAVMCTGHPILKVLQCAQKTTIPLLPTSYVNYFYTHIQMILHSAFHNGHSISTGESLYTSIWVRRAPIPYHNYRVRTANPSSHIVQFNNILTPDLVLICFCCSCSLSSAAIRNVYTPASQIGI